MLQASRIGLFVLIDQHHHALPCLPVQAPPAVARTAPGAVAPSRRAPRLAFDVRQLLRPIRRERQAAEQLLASLEQFLEGVDS